MNGLSCQKIIDTAKKINRVVSIGSQRKFEQVFIKVLQHAKKVGEVQYSRNMRLTNWG